MATDFIGLRVHLKLKHPHNYDLTGLITDVREHRLYLANVHLTATNQYLPTAQFLGSEVEDIEVLPLAAANTQPSLPIQQSVQPYTNGHGTSQGASMASVSRKQSWQHTGLTPSSLPPQPKSKKPLQDPAILSFTRSDVATRPNAPAQRAPAQTQQPTPTLPLSSSAAELSATRSLPNYAPAPVLPPTAPLNDRHDPARLSATLSTPFNAMNLEDDKGDDATGDITPTVADAATVDLGDNYPDNQADPNDLGMKSKTRRGRRGNRRKKNSSELQDISNIVDSSPEMNRTQLNLPHKGGTKGWRDTPIIKEPEPQPEHTKNVPGLIGGKIARRAANASAKKTKRQRALEAKSGWATEDVSDIQDMGDFDFEANLSQFDKKAVFEELRKGDTTADEDRLAAINRPQGPGALYHQRKLRHDENVLDRQRINVQDPQSTNDESDKEQSKNTRKQMNRKPSDRAPALEYSRSGSDFMRSGRTLSHAKYSSSHATGSPHFRGGAGTPPSPATVTKSKRPSLRYKVTGRSCPTISPSTLAVVENLAVSQYSLNDEMLDMKAGLTIASTVLTYVRSNSGNNPSSGRPSVSTASRTSAYPVLVFLIGDHKGGARALVAARELLERSFECIVVVAPWQADDLLHFAAVHPRIGAQLLRFSAAAVDGRGKVCTWADGSRYLKTLEAPPELIIDALASLLPPNSANQEANWSRDPTAASMAAWANRSKAAVLSVDIPSGVDAVTGDVEVIEGEPAEIRSQVVVCGGAPMVGLVRALETRREEWSIIVGDTGIGPAWRLFAERTEKSNESGRSSRKGGDTGAISKFGVDFGDAWSVEVKFNRGAD